VRSIFCILILLNIYVMPSLAGAAAEVPASNQPVKRPFVLPGYYKKYTFSFGDPNAPIKIHKFFSFSCASCLKFHQLHFPEIQRQFVNSGKVQWILVPYVMDVDTLYVMATLSACLDDVKLHAVETLMDSALNWTDDDNKEKIIQALKACDISDEVIKSTLSDVNYELVLRDSFDFQEHIIIDGTPTLYINGEEISGIPGAKKLTKIIADMLNYDKGAGNAHD
jgi:protein-disulfide isomerase